MMITKSDPKAAFSQIDISPDFPVELIGCFRKDSTSSGILHPLLAQVLLFEADEKRYCIICIDSLGLTVELSNELRNIVAQVLHTERSHIMLNFSHTHSAPAPLSPLNGKRYFHLLCTQIKAAAQQASKKLQPCLVSWALETQNISENRREVCDSCDHRLGALKVCNKQTKEPIALLLRVSAHANILMTKNNQISSDYFSKARELISQHFNCPVMILQGASGNMKPIGIDKINGSNLSDLNHIATLLYESAKALQFSMDTPYRLTMFETEPSFCSDVPTEQEARRIAKEARTQFGIDGSAWIKECRRLRAEGMHTQYQTRSIQFLFINQGCLCGLPEEIFCELALEAAQIANAPFLFLNGYTNGTTSYLPPSQEWEKGGYETLYSFLLFYQFHGHVLPYKKDTAKQIIDHVAHQWKLHSTLD